MSEVSLSCQSHSFTSKAPLPLYMKFHHHIRVAPSIQGLLISTESLNHTVHPSQRPLSEGSPESSLYIRALPFGSNSMAESKMVRRSGGGALQPFPDCWVWLHHGNSWAWLRGNWVQCLRHTRGTPGSTLVRNIVLKDWAKRPRGSSKPTNACILVVYMLFFFFFSNYALSRTE